MVGAAHVLRVRDGLKVRGTDAIFHPAKVVDLEAGWDRPERLLPHRSVSKSLATANADATVSSSNTGRERQNPARRTVAAILDRVIVRRDGQSLRGTSMRSESRGMTLACEAQMFSCCPSLRFVGSLRNTGNLSASALAQSVGSHGSKYMGKVG